MTPEDQMRAKLAAHGVGPDTDLLGDPVTPPPKMDDPLPWRVWQMNDCDWVMARTSDEALEAYALYCGVPRDRLFKHEMVDSGAPHELSDDDLQRLVFTDEDAEGNKVQRSFAAELDRRVHDKCLIPPRPIASLFASTEY